MIVGVIAAGIVAAVAVGAAVTAALGPAVAAGESPMGIHWLFGLGYHMIQQGPGMISHNKVASRFPPGGYKYKSVFAVKNSRKEPPLKKLVNERILKVSCNERPYSKGQEESRNNAIFLLMMTRIQTA